MENVSEEAAHIHRTIVVSVDENPKVNDREEVFESPAGLLKRAVETGTVGESL